MKFITALLILSVASSQAQGPICPITEHNDVKGLTEGEPEINQVVSGADEEVDPSVDNQPRQIGDEDGAEPSGWLLNFLNDFEPWFVPDPDAKIPEDWDAEMDGDWEPPMISNPIDEGKPRKSLRGYLHFLFYAFKGSRYSWIWQTVFVIGNAMRFCMICIIIYTKIVEAIVNPSTFNSIFAIMMVCIWAYNLILCF